MSTSLPVPIYSLDVCAPSKASLFTCTPNSFPLAIENVVHPPPPPASSGFPFYWVVFITALTCCNFFCLYRPNSQPHIPLQLPLHFSLLLHRKSPESSHLLEFSLFNSFQSGFDDHHSIVLVKVTTECLCC